MPDFSGGALYMDNKEKNRLAEQIQDVTADQLKATACPVCGCGLAVQFAPGGKRGKGAGSLSVMCRQCMWRVVTDGVAKEPAWVNDLGPKFHTADTSPNKKKKRATPTVSA